MEEKEIEELDGLKQGDKVTYVNHGKSQQGKVKRIENYGASIFVVYHCNRDWDNYMEYTGQLTPAALLKKGWI